jgi:hypothetical protein
MVLNIMEKIILLILYIAINGEYLELLTNIIFKIMMQNII